MTPRLWAPQLGGWSHHGGGNEIRAGDGNWEPNWGPGKSERPVRQPSGGARHEAGGWGEALAEDVRSEGHLPRTPRDGVRSRRERAWTREEEVGGD